MFAHLVRLQKSLEVCLVKNAMLVDLDRVARLVKVESTEPVKMILFVPIVPKVVTTTILVKPLVCHAFQACTMK